MRTGSFSGRENVIALSLLVLSVVYLSLFIARGWIPHDEGMLGQSAERVLKGAVPHVNYEEPYTGGLTWMHAAVFRLVGIDLLYLRWLLFAGAAVTQLVIYAIFRRYLGPIPSAIAAWVSLTWSFPNYFAAVPSWWILICALGCTWAFIRYVETGKSRYSLLCGVAAGVSILIKQTGLYVLIALVMALAYGVRRNSSENFSSRAARFVLILIASVAGLLALGILKNRLSLADLLYLFLPIAACSRQLLYDSTRNIDFDELKQRLVPALVGAAVPLACFVAPYLLRQDLPTLVNGLFVLPQRRVQFASMEMPPAQWILGGIPLMLVVIPVGPTITSRSITWRLAWTLCAIAAALVATSLYTEDTYQLIWQSVRGAAALLPVGIFAFRVSEAERDPKEQRVLFFVATMLAWASLVQFPFSAPIYFCYVAPLVVIGGVATTGGSPTSVRLLMPVAAVLLLFAICTMNRGYVYNLGAVHSVVSTVPLKLERASLEVSSADAVTYRRVMALIAAHIGNGTLVAGPDAPEVYFLSGRFSPSGTLFDFFDDHSSMERGVGDLPGWQRASVVVLNHGRRFSFGPSTEFAAKVRHAFPRSEAVGTLEVRWR